MTGKALLLHVLVKKTSWSIAFEIDATTLIISRYKHNANYGKAAAH